MVAMSNVVRRVEIVGSTSGLDEATNKLSALAQAQTKVTQTADGMAVTTEKSARRAVSVAGAFDQLRMKQDAVFRSAMELAKGQQTVDRAFQQGFASIEEHSRQMQLLTARYGAVTVANDNLGKAVSGSMGLARHELINLSRQAQDVAVSLAGGQSPLTVLFQQGSQIGDVFATSKGTVSGFGAQLASLITPARAIALGVAAVGAATVAGYAFWKSYTLQLDDAARASGTTTRELSKLQAVASIKGISSADFGSGISGFARSVYEAKQNMGGLADVFQANNVKAKTFDEYLNKSADLIRAAGDDQQRLVLLQQMGLPATMEWVRLLSGGANGLKEAKERASEFAANDELISSARRFDEAWNRAWTNFGLNARSAFQHALEFGQTFFDKMDRLAKQAGNSTFWNNFLPADHAERASKAGITPLSQFDQRFAGSSSNPARNNFALSDGLGRAAANLLTPTVDPAAVARANQLESQRISLLGQTATVGQQVRAVELQIAAARASHVDVSEKEAATLLKIAREQANGTAQIKSQVDAINVQAATIGMTAGAAAEYTAKQTLLNEAIRQHKVLTDADKAAIDEQAKALGLAAQAAAKKQVNDQINFDKKTVGLSAEDIQIAQQLRGVYDDVTTSLNSTEAAQIRLNNELRAAKDLANAFGQDLLGGLLRGDDAMKSLGGAATSLIAKLSSKQLDNFMNGKFEGGNNLGSMQGVGTIAAAGIAGYQSGSLLTGGLGGAMSGFAVGGPIGAAVGGIAGLIGGIFGNAHKKAEEEAAAIKAANDRAEQYSRRAVMAGLDTSAVVGELVAFDVVLEETAS